MMSMSEQERRYFVVVTATAITYVTHFFSFFGKSILMAMRVSL